MTRYLSIQADQRPFPVDRDEQRRTLYSVNFTAQAAAPVADWEREIRALIVAAGAAATGSILLGATRDVPISGGPWVQIIDTGGPGAIETHDDSRYELLSAQILVRALDPEAARDLALTIWRALDGRYNLEVAA